MGEALECAARRMEKHLRRRGLLLRDQGAEASPEGGSDPEANLAASAVSGQAPPAGWPRSSPTPSLTTSRCGASLDGFTLHAATHAPALDQAGREALLRYVLRPPIAQERVDLRPDGLVRITLKKAYADGTLAVDMDPLSLLCRWPPACLHLGSTP